MINCRGRNKWFNLHEAQGYVMGRELEEAAVSIRSKRQYLDMPPIYFSGPVDEMVALLDTLKAQILADQAEKQRRRNVA